MTFTAAKVTRGTSDSTLSLESADARKAWVDAVTESVTVKLTAIDSLLAHAVNGPPYSIGGDPEPVVHPPFDGGALEVPVPPPVLEPTPPKPVYQPPKSSTGILKLIGGKQRYQQLEQAARAEWQEAHLHWRQYINNVLPSLHREAQEKHQAAENQRLRDLADARTKYDKECAERENAVRVANEEADKFRFRVTSNDHPAVVEFLQSIFRESPYPSFFPVTADIDYDSVTREARVAVSMPSPGEMPTVKSIKVMSSGEIREVKCTQPELKARYNAAVAAVAIRSIYEVFTAEPAGVVDFISLTVSTDTVNPATGHLETFCFVETAAARDDLVRYNFGQVDPVQTLKHMRAVVSKDAFGLQQIDKLRGIRK